MSTTQRTLFGTDGIRGIANVDPMTSEMALQLGRAIAHVFQREPRRHRILIGKDTRISGYMLETAMASGICSMGVDVLLVGPMPTPGIAFLTRSMRADAGVVISASHNAFQDNGIKFFAHDGFKLPDDTEAKIEALVLGTDIDHLRPTAHDIGKAFRVDDAGGRYNSFLKSTFPRDLSLDGLRVAFDGAHGAAYRIGPEVLTELGAQVFESGVDPDGKNINAGCGALYPEAVAKEVLEHGCDIGIALDGDADRCLLVDEKGVIADGDEILAIAASELLARDALPERTVVATVMSNLGFDRAIERLGGKVVRTPVGDRYVVEEMVRGGYRLGGEASGHLIFLEHTTTGDGLLSALAVLGLMVKSGKRLSELRGMMQRYPQVLVNVPVTERRALGSLDGVQAAVARAETVLGTDGRVVVRYSGTELLARVMIEGEQEDTVRRLAEEIADAFRGSIGAS